MRIFQFEQTLGTSYDNQSFVHYGIYEGERAKIENNHKFGKISLQLDNENKRRGYPLKVGIYDLFIDMVFTGFKYCS